MTDLQDLPIADLRPHPNNPRLRLRDDVVTQIAAEITRSGFGREHALLVRPKDGHYEILSGHHRHEAAKRTSLATVPCWVRDVDDDEAFMQLILANTQGELSPLEEGHHVHYYVERSQVGAGRGNKGGLSEYARRLNKSRPGLSMKRAAYEVYEKSSSLDGFTGSYLLLVEISKAPPESWEPLAAAMTSASKTWTAKDVAAKVAEVAKFEIPARHAAWLPRQQVTDAYLRTERPTPGTVQRLVEAADGVLTAIEEEDVATDADAAEFRAWLVANTGGESWDHRKISGYHANLIADVWPKRREELDGGRVEIHECRAADLIEHIEPGSADLIFTDPPYPVEFVECWTELGELAVKTLKPGGLLVAYTGQYTMPEALDRLRAAGLSWFWCYAVQHDGAFFRMNATHVQCAWKPLLVMRNGVGDLPNWHKDLVADGSREKSTTVAGNEFHGGDWQQSQAEAAYWISELTAPDALVVDPFCGSGTTAVACKDLGRRFVGCDIDPKAIDAARERLAQ